MRQDPYVRLAFWLGWIIIAILAFALWTGCPGWVEEDNNATIIDFPDVPPPSNPFN